MAEDSAVLDLWRQAPPSIFEAFRDCAVALAEATVASYRLAERNHEYSVISAIQLAEKDFGLLEAKLASAREFWKKTPIHRYLTRPQPIIVREGISTRFDGCCYHDVALNFGQHLLDSAWDMKCSDYFKMVRSATGRGDFASDYLFSLVAHIRSECQAGIEKWKLETGELQEPQKTSANEKNTNKFFPDGVPDDPDLVDLAVRLDAAKGSGKRQLDVARELTGEAPGSDPKAKRLLARIRMMRQRGKLNL